VKVVELVVTHPLVNILRGAMGILVSVVSRPCNPSSSNQSDNFGFKALKPAISAYPQFLEMLVSRLSSADHALCANALQLINSLMRDAIMNDAESEWPKFIKRLQDLGVIKAVYVLMQSSAIQDLAHPLLEFQALTKVLLRRWKDVPVDLQKPEHRRALKGIHLASNPEKAPESSPRVGEEVKPKHNPEKWRRLGFETESPAWEFQEMGFLGMMDLTDYVRKHQDEFQRLLLEQSEYPMEKRCPIARASLATTAILYEHFEVDKSDLEDAKSYLALESRASFDKVFKPLLLHWSRLHVASLHALFRLWKATGAELEDFQKMLELVRILVESVVGGAPRTKDVHEVEEELCAFELQRLRELQMELLELTYEDVWGPHLRQAKDELQHEALQFVKEQRIRCLLQGTWFPTGLSEADDPLKRDDPQESAVSNYRYVQLSHNRRYLHWGDFDTMGDQEPELDSLPDKSKSCRDMVLPWPACGYKSREASWLHATPFHGDLLGHLLTDLTIVDLSIVSSVVSNVSASSADSTHSDSTLKILPHDKATTTNTKITIHGYLPPNEDVPGRVQHSRLTNHSHQRQASKSSNSSHNQQKESVLLTLYPQSHSVASEWLDGLLMLLNQQPITAETNKLINMVSSYGLKIRLLNVRFDEKDMLGEAPEIPSREGLDEDYYYDL
jgi:engulfment/cell motility protein 1